MGHEAWDCEECGALVPADDVSHHLMCQRLVARERYRQRYVQKATRWSRLACFFRGHKVWSFNHRWEPWCSRCGGNL